MKQEKKGKKVLGIAAAAGLALAVVAFVGLVRERPAPVPEAGFPADRGVVAAPPAGEVVRFFALGDSGCQTEDRERMRAAMTATLPSARPDFVVLLGDNFYPNGIESVDSEGWGTHFEDVFPAAAFDMPFHAILGNHDHEGNVAAQEEYGLRSARWHMPGRYYTSTWRLGDAAVLECFYVDTMPIRLKDRISASQLRWLEDKLARSTATWKVVFGHHPLASGGGKGGSTVLGRRLLPLLEEHGVDLYVSGHDHDLQLVTVSGKLLQVVSGAACDVRPTGRIGRTLFAQATPGFARVDVTDESLLIEFVTDEGVRFRHVVTRGDVQ